MKNNKVESESEVNFTVKQKEPPEHEFQIWKLWLALHLFFYYLANGFHAALTYSPKPLYMRFRKSWAKKFSRWFRFLVLLIPAIVTVRIALDYTNAVWWYVTVCASAVLTIPALVLFLIDIAYKIKNKAFDASVNANSSVFCLYGTPGSGKTSSIFYIMKLLADIMWKQICTEYKLLKPYLKEIPFWPTQQREDAEEIIEAYNFYQNSGTYPCLWSTVPAFVDGIPVNRITSEHLMQKKKMPYGTCGILDEISLILPQALFRTKPDEIMELCKFPRHFGDFHFGTTEQGKNEMFKGLRSSAAWNRCMVQQKWVLKPRLLLWLYNFIIKYTKHMTRAKVTFLRVYAKILNCIGWRKYWYFDSGNENEQIKSKKKTFVLPPYLNIDYDGRAFKNAYRCRNQKLEVSTWSHTRLTTDEVAEIFSVEMKELTKTKKERKKEAEQRRKQKEQSKDAA